MSELQPLQPATTPIKRAFVAGALAFNAMLGSQLQPDSELADQAYAVAAPADYQAVDQMLENPGPVIARVQGYPDETFTDQTLWTVDDRAAQYGVESAVSIFNSQLESVLGVSGSEMSTEAYDALREQKKPELFARLQDLAMEHYGISIRFREELEQVNGPADAPEGEYAMAAPASLADMHPHSIFTLASSLARMPLDSIQAIGLKEISLYNPVAGRVDGAVVGFPDGRGAINLAVNAELGVLEHEFGHEVNRALRGAWYAPDPVLRKLSRIPLQGEGLHPTVTLDEYERRHSEELKLIIKQMQEGKGQIGEYDSGLNMQAARCELARRHPMDAASVSTIEPQRAEGVRRGYYANHPVQPEYIQTEEQSAEIVRALLTYDLTNITDRCLPRLNAIGREILARLHRLDSNSVVLLLAKGNEDGRIMPPPTSVGLVPTFGMAARELATAGTNAGSSGPSR